MGSWPLIPREYSKASEAELLRWKAPGMRVSVTQAPVTPAVVVVVVTVVAYRDG